MELKQGVEALKQALSKVWLGESEIAEYLIMSILAEGHVLMDDVPGVGKTLLAKAFSKLMGGKFRRIQCTPDLLPGDLLGMEVYQPQSGNFAWRVGAVETNVLLVDEINRAVPRTQSALLQAMEERSISRVGQVVELPKPFLVLATENPVEFEGTFPLPEAQRDRFLVSLSLGYPGRERERDLLTGPDRSELASALTAIVPLESWALFQQQSQAIHASPLVLDYLQDLTALTRNDPLLALGLSPRAARQWFKAAQALSYIRGFDYVRPDEVQELFPLVGHHRLWLKGSARVKGATVKTVLNTILTQVKVPVVEKA